MNIGNCVPNLFWGLFLNLFHVVLVFDTSDECEYISMLFNAVSDGKLNPTFFSIVLYIQH